MTTSTGAAVPAANKFPGSFFEVEFGASPNSSLGGVRKVLVLGNKTSAGTGTADTVIYTEQTPATAKVLGGAGSEVHLMVTAALALEPNAYVDMLIVTSTGATAAGTITVVGTCTASGTYVVHIHGVAVSVDVLSGDLIAAIAVKIRDQVNAQTDTLGVTATASLGVVTLTAKIAGLRGNQIKLRQVVDTAITGSAFTLSGAVLTGGSGQDALTTALSTITPSKYDYIVPANIDSTALAALNTQIVTQAGPLFGRRQQAISCLQDTLGNTTTIADAINGAQSQLLWFPGCEYLQCQVSAAWAARRSIQEAASLGVNLSTLNGPAVDLYPVIKAPADAALFITDAQATSALDTGITPVYVRASDKHPVIVRSITTHNVDSSSNPDYRTLDTNKVTVPFGFADELATQFPDQFPNKQLVDDSALDGDDDVPANVTTPRLIQNWAFGVAKTFQNLGYLQSVATDVARWGFSKSTTSSGRCNATMPVTPTDWFVQFSAKIKQMSP